MVCQGFVLQPRDKEIGGGTFEELTITDDEYAILETRNAFVREYSNGDGKEGQQTKMIVSFSKALIYVLMFVGIFAAPCIGPPVLALLTSVADRGIYLGFFERSGKEKPLFVRLKWVAGLAGLIFGISSIFTPKESLAWDEYKLHKVFMAENNKQPVVIDFYADWCIACHELENFVFSNPAVAGELKKFVRLRVDATDMMAPAVRQILEQYGVFGLPIVVFLDGNGEEVEEARVIGYVPPAEFLKSLELALNRSE